MPKLPHDQLWERVYQHLREQILNLEIPPGTRLRADAIAKDIEVSPTPVKAALARLAHEELIEQVPRGGTYVKIPSQQDVDNLFEIRKALEMLAVEKATLLFETSELEGFLAELDRAEKEAVVGNGVPAFEMDKRIHERILCVQPNDLLRRFMAVISSRVQLFRKIGAEGDHISMRLRSLDEHRAIVKAMFARDPKRASMEMGEHIDETRRNFSICSRQ